MASSKRALLAIVAGLLLTTAAYAEEKEALAVFELGTAFNWTAPNASSIGPTVAVEFTPIKDWLEIEIGTGPLFATGSTGWSTIFFSRSRLNSPKPPSLW
jgi:hypothetical protein